MFHSKIAVLLSVAAAVVAIPTPAESLTAPIPGYGVIIPQWEVETSPGHVKILNGTVQEVVNQAIEIDPGFKDILANHVAQADTEPSGDILAKRSTVNCNPRPGTWYAANAAAIEAGVRYLRGIGGQPHMAPGPGNCGRVSCSSDSAIWLCNDRNYDWHLGNWNAVADSAQHIVNTCKYLARDVLGYTYVAVGQNFESGNWNTIVRSDNC